MENMIYFIDFQKEYEEIKDEIQKAINRVLEKQWFILGEELEQFENEFSQYLGIKHGIGVNSGSDALYLAIIACGIGNGDEVITVSHTFISTVDAITRNGAKPVFIDIDPETYNIDVSKIEKKITKKTKAIIPVHLYGNPVDMNPLMEIGEKYGLYLIEDACQAHGAEYYKKKVGTIGHIACFSFYPTKNLGTYGNGGMIVTDNKELALKIQLSRNYGSPKKYHHDFIGINSRLDELQASILRVKLNYLDKWNEKRRNNAKLYNELLEGTKIITPVEKEYAKHIFHLYVIQAEKRNKLKKNLEKHSIQTLIHYPIPVHLQKAYSNQKFAIKLPITEKMCKNVLSLPIHPWLNEEDIASISMVIKKNSITSP